MDETASPKAPFRRPTFGNNQRWPLRRAMLVLSGAAAALWTGLGMAVLVAVPS